MIERYLELCIATTDF